MKEKFIKNQNGITLVALVITIVVLLILAGVVLSSMQQSGIIGKTKKAEEEFSNASTNETITLKDYEDKINQNTGGSSVGINTKAFVDQYEGDGFVIVVQKNADNSVIFKPFIVDGKSEKYNCCEEPLEVIETNDFQTVYIKFNGEIVELSKNNSTKFYDPTELVEKYYDGHFIMENYLFLSPACRYTAEEASTGISDMDTAHPLVLDPNFDFSILNLE